MHLFYTPDTTTNEYTLPEEESKHCVKVLRLEIGDEIFLVDGKGGFYRCEIIQAHPKRCEVRCVEKTENYGKRDYHIHIAIAPTKNIERIEWFLEKCTEIGIDEITPPTLRSLGTQSNQRRTAGKSDYFCHETILESLPATTQSHDRIFLFCKKQSKLIEVYRPLR